MSISDLLPEIAHNNKCVLPSILSTAIVHHALPRRLTLWLGNLQVQLTHISCNIWPFFSGVKAKVNKRFVSRRLRASIAVFSILGQGLDLFRPLSALHVILLHIKTVQLGLVVLLGKQIYVYFLVSYLSSNSNLLNLSLQRTNLHNDIDLVFCVCVIVFITLSVLELVMAKMQLCYKPAAIIC